MSQLHWKFIRKQTIIAILMNFFMNGLMAWVAFKPAEMVKLQGENSFAFDIVMTTFFLTFFTSFFVSKASYKEVEEERLQPIERENIYKFFQRFPPKPFLGSLSFAAATAFVISPIMMGILILLEAQILSLWSFILFKALYAGILAIIFTPLVASIALAEVNLINIPPK